MYCMFLVSLTIGITLNMSCTIVLPFSIFDSVLWDDNLLQSVPLLPHQDSKVLPISWMVNPCIQGPLLFNGECQRCEWFLELHRKWLAWRALFWGVVQPRYTLSTKVIDKTWAVYVCDVWKATSMPKKDSLRSNNPSCERENLGLSLSKWKRPCWSPLSHLPYWWHFHSSLSLTLYLPLSCGPFATPQAFDPPPIFVKSYCKFLPKKTLKSPL